ncbi:MAG: ParB/RepB/Spo0J family partition protein [Proteobacteria bacterium]|nr:ParB/RepB/Spo0J family partition protein [Pseudomonadota bacterium]
MTWTDEIIHLSSVEIEDHTFRITTEENIETLSCSIRNAGLINHPIVIRKKSGYAVISGFRRIRSAINLGWTSISARTIEPDADRFECAKLAIADNSIQRSLNLIEISRCYKMLSGLCKEKDLPAAASLLCLPDNPALAGKIIRLCDIPEQLQQYILSGSVSMAMALELVKPEYIGSGIQFAEIFDCLKLSLNKQREFLTLSFEIATREGISVLELINGFDFQNILSDEESDRNRKTNKIRQYLKSRRFPVIMKAEDNFRKNLRKLALTGGIKLIPPADFEGNTFIISMEFKTTSEFGELTACLNRLTNDPVLKEIVSKNTSDCNHPLSGIPENRKPKN